MLARTHPERAAELGALLQADADERWRYYSQLATVERTVPHARRSTHAVDASRSTPRKERTRDRSHHPLPRPGAADADRGVGRAADRRRRDGAPARRRRRVGHRPAVAVRGGDPPRRGPAQPRARGRVRALRRGARLLPRRRVRPDDVAGRPPPRPPRGRPGGRRRPRHRQRERHVVGQLDPLRRAAGRRRRVGDRAERVRRRRRRVPVGRAGRGRTTSPSSPTSAPRSRCRWR